MHRSTGLTLTGLADKDKQYVPHHPWPEDCTTQSGARGVVFRAKEKGGGYKTAFFEAFPSTPYSTFLRGEGKDESAAEDAAWAKWQNMLACDHVFERADDKGAARCHKCNMRASHHFESLKVCGACGKSGALSLDYTKYSADIFLKGQAFDQDPYLHSECIISDYMLQRAADLFARGGLDAKEPPRNEISLDDALIKVPSDTELCGREKYLSSSIMDCSILGLIGYHAKDQEGHYLKDLLSNPAKKDIADRIAASIINLLNDLEEIVIRYLTYFGHEEKRAYLTKAVVMRLLVNRIMFDLVHPILKGEDPEDSLSILPLVSATCQMAAKIDPIQPVNPLHQTYLAASAPILLAEIDLLSQTWNLEDKPLGPSLRSREEKKVALRGSMGSILEALSRSGE